MWILIYSLGDTYYVWAACGYRGPGNSEMTYSLGNEVRRWKTLWQSTDRELPNNLHPTNHKRRIWAVVLTDKMNQDLFRSTTPEERFSDLAVDRQVLLRVIRGRRDMPASLYKGSSKKALSCQSVWLNKRVKKETNNYRCCTVLLVLINSVSNLTNLYLWNQNVENLRIQTLLSNSPLPRSFGPVGKHGLDSGLDWTGLDGIFFGGGSEFFVGGEVVLFFLVCKKIAFSTFPQQAIFSLPCEGRQVVPKEIS